MSLDWFDRLILRSAAGGVFLDRRRLIRTPWFRVFLHRMDAPDPGVDLHDHPWSFVTVVLRGGYSEYRADTRDAGRLADVASRWSNRMPGALEHRRPLRPRRMRLDEAHRIIGLHRTPTWTLVIAGRRRRPWGFYVPSMVARGNWVDERGYGPLGRREQVSVERREAS